MIDDKFVMAVNANGDKQYIPRAWLDHPTLGKGFTLAPSQAEADRVAEGPSESWTRQQLINYAEVHGIDVASASRKADVLAAVLDPTYLPADGGDHLDAIDTNEGER